MGPASQRIFKGNKKKVLRGWRDSSVIKSTRLLLWRAQSLVPSPTRQLAHTHSSGRVDALVLEGNYWEPLRLPNTL